MVNTSDILPNTPRYLKVPLIFFNAILLILGVLLIALGAWVLVQLKHVNGLDINVTLSSGLVVLGVFIFILTIVGCIVAYREQLVGLIVYTIVILVLLICLIGVGGAAFSYRSETNTVLDKAWNKTDDGVKAQLEKFFDCCGWGGSELSYVNASVHLIDGTAGQHCITLDYHYTNYTYVNDTDPLNPFNETITNVTTSLHYLSRDVVLDCQPTVSNFVKDKLYVAGVAGVVIGVIEFVCMFFSLFLIVRLCRNPRSRSYD